MLTKRLGYLFLIAGSLGAAPFGACAQVTNSQPMKTIGQATPTGPVPSLFVLNSAGAKLEGKTLTMTGVSPNSIVFADRPVRAAGHVTTEQFIMQWDEGKDSFIKDPPNATISMLGGDGSKVEDAVVTLMKPKLDGGNLTFEVAVLEGSLSGGSGPAALFIDRWWRFRGRRFWRRRLRRWRTRLRRRRIRRWWPRLRRWKLRRFPWRRSTTATMSTGLT